MNRKVKGSFHTAIRRWLEDGDHPHALPTNADFIAEYTELFRRQQLDGLWVFHLDWYTVDAPDATAAGFPNPMAATIDHAMAPTTISWALFDRNQVAGVKLEIPLVLLNDRDEPVTVTLGAALSTTDPGLVPLVGFLGDDDLLAGAHHQLEPRGRLTLLVTVALPAEGG